MNNGKLPAGSKILLIQGADGKCYQTGYARTPQGGTCQCGTMNRWVPQAPSAYGSNFALLSPAALAQVQAQIAQGTSNINNTFGRADLPNQGAVGVARLDAPASPASGNVTFQLVLNNIAGGAEARQVIGDYTGAYVLNGNAEVTPGGFVIGGTWGTNSKTQFAGQTFGRNWKVSRVQMIAGGTNPETFFNLTNSYYYDQGPTKNAPVKDSLTLSDLLSADQYRPEIQWYNRAMILNGFNGFDMTIPAGQSITLQFQIESLGVGTNQVLIGR